MMNRWSVSLRALLIALAMLPLAAESPAAGLELKQVQQHLQAMGYEPGPSDGVMGPRTSDALTAFQMDSGMTVSGQLDETTQNALRARIEACTQILYGTWNIGLDDDSDWEPAYQEGIALAEQLGDDAVRASLLSGVAGLRGFRGEHRIQIEDVKRMFKWKVRHLSLVTAGNGQSGRSKR